MFESRVLRQSALIVISLVIMALAVVVAVNHKLMILLPMAGGLAGMNAFLMSSTLTHLSTIVRRSLKLGGAVMMVFMSILMIAKVVIR